MSHVTEETDQKELGSRESDGHMQIGQTGEDSALKGLKDLKGLEKNWRKEKAPKSLFQAEEAVVDEAVVDEVLCFVEEGANMIVTVAVTEGKVPILGTDHVHT